MMWTGLMHLEEVACIGYFVSESLLHAELRVYLHAYKASTQNRLFS